MKKSFYSYLTVAILTSAIVSFTIVSPGISNAKLSIPILLRSSTVLDNDILEGRNYTIWTAVMNDGLINTYRLNTNYGQYDIESTAALINRINELEALASMEELNRSGVFKNSLVEGVKAPIKGATGLVTSPVETTKGFVKGTGKFLSNIGRSIVSSDPHQDNALKVALGYDAAKRAYAYEFGIDPYTTFTPVVDRLGEIARAAVAGGLVPKATMAVLDHDIVTVMQITAAVNNLKKLVRDTSPGDLHTINKEKLENLKINPSYIESFLKNYNYNPQEKTILIGMLEQMKGVHGLDLIIVNADNAVQRSDVLLNSLVIQMMASYHTKVNPVSQIISIDGTLHLKTSKNIIVLTAPVDYVFATDLVLNKLSRLDNNIRTMTNVKGKELWITGDMGQDALETFKARGWKVVTDATEVFNKE